MESAANVTNHDQEQVDLAVLGVIEKRQSLGAVATAFLSVLVTVTVYREELFGTVALWNALVLLASVFKFMLSRYRRTERFRGVTFKTRRLLIWASAGSTGLLWSVPMTFVDFQNPTELATVMLISSGIISGSISTYLGSTACIALIATAPCFSIIAMLAVKMTPIPYATIISILTFYFFILSVSFRTINDSAGLFKMKFENIELIENLKKTQDVLLSLANRDDLTGLPNRRLLAELFSKFASDAMRNKHKLAILFIDMDEFKPINDTYGHEIGDKVLIEASRIMKKSLRDADIVARLGGDEFVAILKDVGLRSEAVKVVDKLRNALDTTLSIGEFHIKISASIGVSLFPDQSESLEELLKLSDTSMYTDKSTIAGDAKP